MGLFDMILGGHTAREAWRRAIRASGRHEPASEQTPGGRPDGAKMPSGTSAKAFEFSDYRAMIAAFLAEGPPYVLSPVLIDRHKPDWERKQAFSNQTVWFVYCNHGGVVECVWWISGNSMHAAVQGMKCYTMRDSAMDLLGTPAAKPNDVQTG